jgi:hypothetical protein
MKQNPKIKRNAMHAYITYMIYADLSHNGGQVSEPLDTNCRIIRYFTDFGH